MTYILITYKKGGAHGLKFHQGGNPGDINDTADLMSKHISFKYSNRAVTV